MSIRTVDRGLAALRDGLAGERVDFIVVLDADLGHRPEDIPLLLRSLGAGADLVLGSPLGARPQWLGAWLRRRIAVALALPLVHLRDPFGDVLALRASLLSRMGDVDFCAPQQVLEIVVKSGRAKVAELSVPDASPDGRPARPEQWLDYLRHLRRLYTYRYGTWAHLAQFLLIGTSGLAVNLSVLTVALRVGVNEKLAVVMAILTSMVWNFLLNRRFSFSYARDRPVIRQFGGFVAACSIGAVVNYFTTTHLWLALGSRQIAAVVGVMAGTVFDFSANRFIVFRTSRSTR